jgi:hypothetical protein
MNSEQDNKDYVVILGDWFIDENWLVAPRKTYSSSHTGDYHYLSKHSNIDRRMITLCGASEILEVLRNYFEGKNDIEFLGYGAWNKNDDKIIQCTLCSDNIEDKHLTPYTIASLRLPEFKDGSRVCPYDKNQCKFNPNLVNLATNSQNQSSNRIVRCYEGYGGGDPHLLYRIDWELPIEKLDYTKFDLLRDKRVTAVVIEDHGKGVVNKDSIEALISRLGANNIENARWYIRSKIENPNWMQFLAKKTGAIRLKVIDYKLAYYKKGQRRYKYGNKLGRSSLELLGELTDDTVYRHGLEREKSGAPCERAAVLFDDNTVIAKDNEDCYNLLEPISSPNIITIGKTTIFFNALIAQDLDIQFSDKNFGFQCYNALKCACDWSIQASSAWNKEEPHFYGDYKCALRNLRNRLPENSILKPLKYKILWDEWNQSSENLGLLEIGNNNVFQLWRGEGALKGYISVGGPKRSEINRLLSKIHEFVSEKTNKYPFNALLLASPGWGKSFLAKSIANHFEMQFLSFSISQMATTRDLIDCFDIICSVQNSTDKKTLIFLDEINCEIEGNHAMGLLLSPIWDGSFIRDGKRYMLKPSVWIFASTGMIKEFSGKNKGSDFISRLNGPIIELDSLVTKNGRALRVPIQEFKQKLIENPEIVPEDDNNFNIINDMKGQFRTEQVYLGVSLLNSIWGPISKIQLSVLELFQNILLINGFRSMEFFISMFHNIERGTVYASNVPFLDTRNELKRHVILPKIWRKSETRPDDLMDLVNIETLINITSH